MTHNIRWRKAAIVSVICHIFLFLGAGYLSAYIFTLPEVEEQFVELDLVSEFQTADYKDTAPAADMSLAAISQANSTPLQTSSTVAHTESISTVTTEAMSVITSDNMAAAFTTETATSGNVNGRVAASSDGNGKAQGLIPPNILKKAAPSYPRAARQAGIEGAVVLKVQILANGRTGSITISRSSGNELLDNAAIAAVEQWRFVPAKDANSGQAVACYTTLPISFHLQ